MTVKELMECLDKVVDKDEFVGAYVDEKTTIFAPDIVLFAGSGDAVIVVARL